MFRLESPLLTAAFWGAVVCFVAAFWLTPFPPLIDYPQHVAVGAILHRWFESAAFERGMYDIDLVTYNGGFHLAVAGLSYFVSPEVAGKILLSLYPPMLALAELELVRASGRPRWYALLVLPITLSFAVGWGFANYFISVPLALLVLGWWIRANRGESRLYPRIAVASLIIAYTHVLVTIALCLSVAVFALSRFRSLGSSPFQRLGALVRLPLPFMGAIAWCVVVFFHNRYSSHANWEGWDDGLDDPLWFKLLHVTAYAVGNFGDHSDQVLLAGALAIIILLWQSPEHRAPSDPQLRALAICWAALYCVIPKVFIATWFIFERFPTWALAFLVAAVPVVTTARATVLAHAAAMVALAAGLNTVFHLARIPGERDADAIIDDIPAGKRVVAVTWSNDGLPVVLREMWVHVLAYYQARRPGLIGYSFAKFESMPVHYRPGIAPPFVPGGMEWDARKYDPHTDYARYFDVVLVRTPDSAPDDDPRAATFRELAPRVTTLSHRGRFWLYDGSALRQPENDASAPRALGDRTGLPAAGLGQAP
jgi:hypothetical protein